MACGVVGAGYAVPGGCLRSALYILALLPAAAAAGTPCEERSAASAESRLRGPDGAGAGVSVAGVGDIDGDGLPDLLVGGRGDGEEGGGVWLVTAVAVGEVALDGYPSLIGEDGNGLGASLTAAGDLTGSAVADLAVGAPGYGDEAGAVVIVAGPPVDGFTGDIEPPTAFLVGAPGQGFGRAIAGPLDTDGDARVELLVGAPDEAAGAVYLFEGPITGTWSASRAEASLVGIDEGDAAGHSVADAGDMDGDGRGDLVIGAPGASAAYLWLGPVSGTRSMADADAQLTRDEASLGWAVAGVGDMDGDGLDDVLIGAPDEGAGEAWLVTGAGEVAAVLLGVDDEDEAGASVAGAGDVNGDGLLDLLVGGSGDGGGTAWLVLGPVSGTSSLATADGTYRGAAEESLGIAIAGPGDVDGDGFADLLFGAPAEEADGDESGAAYLFMGGVCGVDDDCDEADEGCGEDTDDTDDTDATDTDDDLSPGGGCSCEGRGTGGTFAALPLVLLLRRRAGSAR